MLCIAIVLGRAYTEAGKKSWKEDDILLGFSSPVPFQLSALCFLKKVGGSAPDTGGGALGEALSVSIPRNAPSSQSRGEPVSLSGFRRMGALPHLSEA